MVSDVIVSKESKPFFHTDDKTSRRVLVHGPSLMLVEFRFRKGGIGKMHQHEHHEQVGYVAKGSFEITVGGEKKIAREGDCYYADRNVPHGVVAMEEDSVLIDTFTPIREDFLSQ
jgi:quercetin dioxygenase-like cupin family protein